MFRSEIARKVAANTSYQLLGKVVSTAVTIFATILITRTYGRDGYGAFSLMQNFPALVYIIVDFGINAIAVREISRDHSKASEYFNNILILRVLLAASFMLVMAGILQVFPYSEALRTGIYLSLFLIISQALYATTNIVFQSKLRYDLSSIGYIFGTAVTLLFVFFFSYFRFDVMWVSFSYVLGGAATFLVNYRFLTKFGVKLNLRINKVLWKFLFLQSLPLGLMFIFSQLNFKADTILLSVMDLPSRINLTNTESVAIYNLPYKVFEVSLVIPTFFMNAVYPVMVSRMVEGKNSLLLIFRKALKSLTLFGIVSSVAGFIFAPLVIKLLGGGEFFQSVTVMRILFSFLFLFYISQPLSWLIVTLGNQKVLPYVYAGGAVFNIGLNLIYIPRYSFYASAVITLLSEFFILVFLAVFAHRSWRSKYAA